MSSKVYSRISDFPKGKQGMTAILASRSSYSLYIFINNKWRHYANALSPMGKGEGGYKNRGSSGKKSMVGELELMSRPTGSNTIGTIGGNITSKRGIVGDTCINIGGHGRTSTPAAKWQIFTNGGGVTEINSSQTTLGDAKALPYDASTLDSHYNSIVYIAPHAMRVNGVSIMWGDTSGTTDGRQHVSLWTSPSGISSTVADTGTGTKTYTLKYIKTKSSTTAAGAFNQVSDNSLGANAFDLNAGDWVIIGIMNDEWSGSGNPYVAVNATLYCKFR